MDKQSFFQKFKISRKKLRAIGIAILCVAIIVTVIILGYPHRTAPINYFCKALQKGSFEELEKCMPEEAWDYAAEQYAADGTKSDTLYDDMTLFLLQTEDALTDQFGEKLRVTFRVTDKQDYDNSSLWKLAQMLSAKFDLNPLEITEACCYTVETITKGTLGKEIQEGDQYIVYKYHEKWYLYFDPLNGSSDGN